jgi:voltage-gated potassium channel
MADNLLCASEKVPFGGYHRRVSTWLAHVRTMVGRRPIVRLALLWLGIVVGVIAVGVIGYMVIDGWSFEDGLYMTVITLTTVGFREVHEQATAGRAWTMLLSISGVAIIFGTVGLVAESIIAEAVSGRRERWRMERAVKNLGGHFILCGYGRVGRTVARELEHSGIGIVVIDINQASVDDAARDGHLVVAGDATNDEVLLNAGIERARGLIATTDSDAHNVYVVLSGRAINPGLFIVARANGETAEAKLRQAGADRTVSPYARAGRQMAELATRPRVADFIDFALSHGQLAYSIQELDVGEGGPLAGQKVADLIARGIHPLAVAHGPLDFEANPLPDRVLVAGDQLIVGGAADALATLRENA